MAPIDKHKQRQAERHAAAQMEAELGREQGDYRPPDRSECVLATEAFMPIDDAGTLRITTRIWRLNGRMTEFVLKVEVGDWGDPDSWQRVAKIDCSGGTCHEHPISRPDEHHTIHRLDSIDDVERAYPVATSRIDELARMIRDRRTR